MDVCVICFENFDPVVMIHDSEKGSNPICDSLGLPHALLCAYFEFAYQQKFDIIKGVEF